MGIDDSASPVDGGRPIPYPDLEKRGLHYVERVPEPYHSLGRHRVRGAGIAALRPMMGRKTRTPRRWRGSVDGKRQLIATNTECVVSTDYGGHDGWDK